MLFLFVCFFYPRELMKNCRLKKLMLLVFTHWSLHKSIIMGAKLQLSDVHVKHMAADSFGCFFKLF